MLSRVTRLLNSLDEKAGVYRIRRFDFMIDGSPAAIIREWWIGRLTLHVDGEAFELQSPLRLSTHFTVSSTKRWARHVRGHEVIVEAKLRLPFPAVRRTLYRILVDGSLVKEASLRL